MVVPLGRRDGYGQAYGSEIYNSVYATAVYNDESHTFEQVIQALTRSLDIVQRVAVELATCIDREGRSIVRCASYQVKRTSRKPNQLFVINQINRALLILTCGTDLHCSQERHRTQHLAHDPATAESQRAARSSARPPGARAAPAPLAAQAHGHLRRLSPPLVRHRRESKATILCTFFFK